MSLQALWIPCFFMSFIHQILFRTNTTLDFPPEDQEKHRWFHCLGLQILYSPSSLRMQPENVVFVTGYPNTKMLMYIPAVVSSSFLPVSRSDSLKTWALHFHWSSFPAKLANCDEKLCSKHCKRTQVKGKHTLPGTWHKRSWHLHNHLQLRYGGPRQWCQTQPDQKYCETP